MREDLGELRARYVDEVAGQVPEGTPAGAAVEVSDGLVRTHYGTHGTVDHCGLPVTGAGADDLAARQLALFAARGEPVEWRVPADAAPGMTAALTRAGFVQGWSRSVLAARASDLPAVEGISAAGGVTAHARVRQMDTRTGLEAGRVLDAARRSGPHRLAFDQARADGPAWWHQAPVFVLESDGRLIAASWGERLRGTSFAAVNGWTQVRPELLAIWRAWALRNKIPYLLTEADDGRAAELGDAGFLAVSALTSYHWAPDSPAARTRPVSPLHDTEYDRIWDAFEASFRFRPGITSVPAITEPAQSVTWHLESTDAHAPAAAEMNAIIEGALLRCAQQGEELYWLDWQHASYRFDPHRAGQPGQPPWPGAACPDGDYYIYLAEDLRMGTFGHPWEPSLCVFGASLLAQVENDLTRLLGQVLRRGGNKQPNTWTYHHPDPE
ncbi:MAG TPA: DUF2716 domain-containing protein [Streptosporangiaceae bacterium]